MKFIPSMSSRLLLLLIACQVTQVFAMQQLEIKKQAVVPSIEALASSNQKQALAKQLDIVLKKYESKGRVLTPTPSIKYSDTNRHDQSVAAAFIIENKKKIIVYRSFLNLNQEMQEFILAHELGHLWQYMEPDLCMWLTKGQIKLSFSPWNIPSPLQTNFTNKLFLGSLGIASIALVSLLGLFVFNNYTPMKAEFVKNFLIFTQITQSVFGLCFLLHCLSLFLHRQTEYDADCRGVIALDSCKGGIDFFKYTQKEDPLSSIFNHIFVFLSTHPSSYSRIKALKNIERQKLRSAGKKND